MAKPSILHPPKYMRVLMCCCRSKSCLRCSYIIYVKISLHYVQDVNKRLSSKKEMKCDRLRSNDRGILLLVSYSTNGKKDLLVT